MASEHLHTGRATYRVEVVCEFLIHRGFIIGGYDGGQNVRDEEGSVGRKALSRKPEPKRGIAWPRWTGFRGMSLRDWLPIVGALLIPVMIALGTWGITWQQGKIENQRAQAERELAEQRAQDEALQAYLDQMGSLLLERDLRTSKSDSEVRTLARVRTLTVLERLDPSRKTVVMQFLIEAHLVQRVAGGGRDPIILLDGANLSHVDLRFADLFYASLSHANLSHANLSDVDLSHADLFFVNLSDANLSRANLFYANLSDADLSHANLSKGFLGGANLSDAKRWTEKQLTAADSLLGTTMPNGQKYEEWLKDREGREQNE